MIFNEFFIFIAIVVLIRDGAESSTDFGSLCKIEIFVVKNQFEYERKEKITFNNIDLNQTEIFADQYYEAVCLTNEQVRSANFIYLETYYNSEEKSTIKQEYLANETQKGNNLSYLKGGFTIDSSKQKLNHSLVCRFLPINPVGIYCMKRVRLTIIPKTNQNLKIFFIILSIVILIGIANLFIKCFIMRRKKSSSNLKHMRRSSSLRSHPRTNKKSDTLKNGNLDINCSIYSLDDIQVKIAQKNDSTSQVMINGQALNRM